MDILYVIPIFDNKSIANESAWCNYILGLNKTIGMHGVYHTYHEFGTPRNESYILEGIDAFEKCFGYKPILFKAPFLVLSKENKKTLQNNGFEIQGYPNQVMHKVYHCAGAGWTSPKLQDWF